MRNKRILLIIGPLVILGTLVIGVMIGWSNYASPAATAKRFVAAVAKKDFAAAKKICPRYTDESKISEKSYTLLFNQLSKNSDEKFLLDKMNFKTENTGGVFSKTFFLPEKRYVELNTENSKEQVSVFQKKTEVPLKDNKLGPLIPYEYTFEFEIVHPTLGEVIKKETLSLDKDKEKKLTLSDSAIFLSDSSFQKEIVTIMSDFFISYNQCIQQNFDFSLLSNTDEEVKQELSDTMAVIKPLIETYSLSFQSVIMDSDSLKMSGDQQTLYFDIYIDRILSIQLKQELTESNSMIQDDSENATVSLTYDSQSKKWLVSEIDFDTYARDPAKWKNAQKIKLKQRNEATWNSLESDKII